MIADGAEAPILPPYRIERLPGGERLGFIGLTTRDTPKNVSASGVRGLTFADEVPTVDRSAKELQAKDVEAVVLLLHEGGQAPGRRTTPNATRTGRGRRSPAG